MERFLERSGYAEDRILQFFARLIGDQFFVQKKDILVHDEDLGYRSPLITALIESYIEDSKTSATSKISGSEEETREKQARIRALVLTEHEEVLIDLQKLFAIASFDSLVISSDTALKEANMPLSERTVVAMPTSLFLAATQVPEFKAREFGLVVLEGADLFGDTPGEVQRRIWGYLLPPWQRRAAIFAKHIGIRTRNTALDFANDPKTIVLKKAQASLSQISTYMYRLSSQHKFRVLLAMIQENFQEDRRAIIVFCNLRQTSMELEFRLKLNNIKAKQVSISAPKAERKELLLEFAEIEKKAEGGQFVLVVSNDNLSVLPSELANLAIHYDIPLDPDIYLERVRIMRPSSSTIIGLVCERYEVGLSAINSKFDMQFELREPSYDMLEYRDESEGVPLKIEYERRSSEYKPRRRIEQSKDKTEDAKRIKKTQHRELKENFHQGQKAQHNRKNSSPKKSPGVDQNSELYSMSTDERLAYFRQKYRGILNSPIEPKPHPKKGEKTISRSASEPLSFENTIPTKNADGERSISAADSIEVRKGDKKQASGMESDNPSIVKRFIEKLFPGTNEGTDEGIKE